MGKTDEEATAIICKYIQVMPWNMTKELGLNQQQVVKIKKGEPVRFYGKVLKRLREHFKVA